MRNAIKERPLAHPLAHPATYVALLKGSKIRKFEKKEFEKSKKIEKKFLNFSKHFDCQPIGFKVEWQMNTYRICLEGDL